jgi:5-methylcytosine-specific restriction endonuclease McrA
MRGYCKTHASEKFKPGGIREKANRSFYSSSAWLKLRGAQLAEQPLCEIRKLCDGLPATEVDHVIPIEAGGDSHNIDNLQSACKRCHSWKTITTDIPLIREYKSRHKENEQVHNGNW